MNNAEILVPLGGRPPPWLRGRVAHGVAARRVDVVRDELGVTTVCETSRCLNQGRCWSAGTATLQLMGTVCTRACRFCHTGRGGRPGPLDREEPSRVAEAVESLGLAYAVLTAVDRDDLADGGAAHLARCVRAVHGRSPSVRVELLAPDFAGDEHALGMVVESGLDAFAHNIETVERLTSRVRDRRAGYGQSLDVLGAARAFAPSLPTKSGLMLGLGETAQEIERALGDLLAAGVSIVTLGQYLPPSSRHLRLERYVAPEEFAHWAVRARALGFSAVAAGPLVRSSYEAGPLFDQACAS